MNGPLAVVPTAVLSEHRGRSHAVPVWVETYVGDGLPSFDIIGVAGNDVREIRDRVRAAILSNGFAWPMRRITINVAGADVRRSRPSLDLPIAVGLLVASGQLDAELIGENRFIGELGLDGSIRRVQEVGLLVNVLSAGPIVVPTGCEQELAPFWGWQSMATLTDVVAFLRRGPQCPTCLMREGVR